MVLLLRLDNLCSVSIVHYTCQCSMRHIPKGCFQLVTSPRTASLLALYLSKHLDAFQVAADCALQVHGFLIVGRNFPSASLPFSLSPYSSTMNSGGADVLGAGLQPGETNPARPCNHLWATGKTAQAAWGCARGRT